MTIDTREVISYIDAQKNIFELMPANSFSDGVLQGLNLIKAFLEVYEKKTGDDIQDDYLTRLKENQELHKKQGE